MDEFTEKCATVATETKRLHERINGVSMRAINALRFRIYRDEYSSCEEITKKATEEMGRILHLQLNDMVSIMRKEVESHLINS